MQVLPDGSALATVENISNIGMVVLFDTVSKSVSRIKEKSLQIF